MFTNVECVILSCDNCNEPYENCNGFGIFADKMAAKDDALDDEWIEEDGKNYCPKCYTIDDDDNVIIKSKH